MEQLLEYLQQNKRSKSWLAREIGATPGAVTHWCNGRRVPSDAFKVIIEKVTKGKVKPKHWLPLID